MSMATEFLTEKLGPLPPGDVPAAWYASKDPEVIKGFERFTQLSREWSDLYRELLREVNLPDDTLRIVRNGGLFIGLKPPTGAGITSSAYGSRWLRMNNKGVWVPRRRTRAEKASRVNALFEQLEYIPQAVNYVPGMPDAIWGNDRVHVVEVRKPGEAVLAFLGMDPDHASVPFEVGEQWLRMKMSVYHYLREQHE